MSNAEKTIVASLETILLDVQSSHAEAETTIIDETCFVIRNESAPPSYVHHEHEEERYRKIHDLGKGAMGNLTLLGGTFDISNGGREGERQKEKKIDTPTHTHSHTLTHTHLLITF